MFCFVDGLSSLTREHWKHKRFHAWVWTLVSIAQLSL